MKRDFNKIVTLMRKAYSETLQDGEQEEFEEVLENKALRDVYSEIGDDDYLEKHFARYEKFSPEKAYETFRLNQRKSRFRLILRRVSVAACFILPLLGAGMWMLLQKEQVESPVVLAKKENVQLKLSDGRIVNVSTGNENEIQEQGGLKVRLENGQLSYKQDSVGKSELVYNELIVPQGGECYVVLDDGTRVWVNAGSRIKYPVRFSGKERVVTVKGEAYFDVTKDGRPFVVETNLGKVNVLGTSFGVMAYENEAVLTTLVSGKLYAVSLCDLQYGAVGIACFEEIVQLLDEVGALAEADAVLFGVEAAGVSEVRIARALADHGGSHERVDDGGIRRTGSHLHQRVRLCGDRRNAVAESVQFSFTGGTGFGGKGQILDGFDGLIVGGLISRDDHNLRVVAVGVGARHGACDLGRERHAVPDAVDGLAVKLQNLVVPDDLDEFHLDAEGLGKGLGQIGVKANPFAGFVLVVHRGKIGNADHERALVLNVGKIGFLGGFGRTGCHGQNHQHSQQQSGHLFHFLFLLKVLDGVSLCLSC